MATLGCMLAFNRFRYCLVIAKKNFLRKVIKKCFSILKTLLYLNLTKITNMLIYVISNRYQDLLIGKFVVIMFKMNRFNILLVKETFKIKECWKNKIKKAKIMMILVWLQKYPIKSKSSKE